MRCAVLCAHTCEADMYVYVLAYVFQLASQRSGLRPVPGRHVQSVDLLCAALTPRGCKPLATMLLRMLTQRGVLPCLQANCCSCCLISGAVQVHGAVLHTQEHVANCSSNRG